MNTITHLVRSPLSLIVSAVFAAIPGYGFANEGTANTNDSETIVVTASGYEHIVTEAPATISVITRETLENRSYKDLTDALRDIPGVTVTGGGDSRDISIRGMPAKYTAILVDGRKQSGRELQTNGSTFTEQDWLPPLKNIERIEIVRGPMSTLYGSDALGGVINIITRKDFQEWHSSVRAETILQENSDSGNSHQGQVMLAGPIVDGLLSASLSGLYQERKEDEIDGGYAGKTLENYRAAIHLTPTIDDTFSFEFTQHEQERETTMGSTVSRESQAGERRYDRTSMSLSHSGHYNWGTGTSFVSTETVQNLGAKKEVENLLVNTQWTLPVEGHFVTFGASFDSKQLDDDKLNLTSKNDQWSLFIEDEWSLSDAFTLTAGLRYDRNDTFNGHLSPRVYGVWMIDNDWTLKGGVSTGYRAPSLTEMDKEWVQESCRGRCGVYGNPDLKPESSVNTEMGLYYADVHDLSANVTVFYSDFKDKIENEFADPACTDRRKCDRTYVNISDATVYGVESAVSKSLSENVTLSATYSYTRSEKNTDDDDNGLPLVQAPQYVASLNGNWAMTETVNSWARVNYQGKEKDNITSTSSRTLSPAVTYVDLGANWRITDDVKIMGGIYNLFDKQTSEEEFGYIEDGRRYWLAIEAAF
ncbi:TonB-dependent receptor domain-containing protein [Thaumasiovibrio subtropicus]|uniref:TonB-dependent receptor domain-containing protein n=1 Tax=Thaumasiovibrio subtropicus TaxID=1891207 RepID=UPI000B361B0C|nr:TonB-dependent receptor [Thaumasiovibrio subtropicus]